MSIRSPWESAGPGLRRAAERMMPRFCSTYFRHGEAEALLLFVADERQVGIEDVVGAPGVAGGVFADHRDHHLGVAEAGHRAVGAARQLLRKEQAAVAGEDRDAADVAAIARRTKGA